MELLQTIVQTFIEWMRDLLFAVSGHYAEEFVVKRTKRYRRRRKRRQNARSPR